MAHEIQLHSLSKRAKEVLTDTVARYIAYYQRVKGKKPESVTLSRKQWDTLAASLLRSKQPTTNLTFQGVKIQIEEE